MTAAASRPVALITGARRGIGLAIACAMAKAGFDLAITDLAAPEEGEEAAIELRGLGARVLYLQSDVSAISAQAAGLQAIREHLGPIDCLINNAGMGAVVRGDFLDLLPENFERIMATNLTGAIFLTQAVVRDMLAEPAGHPRSIINITSISAEASSPDRLDYCVSKAGLSAFSQGLALRLSGDAISVFEIRPGIIRTEMTRSVAAKYDALIESGFVPMKRWGEPADIGAICAVLASGSFAFATGTIVHADGGLSIPRL